MTKEKWLRMAEYALLVFVPWGLGTSTRWRWAGANNPLDRWPGDWLELLLLAAWCIAPIVVRPLTTPGVSVQQRYAVSGLILGAGVAWFLWCAEELTSRPARPGGVAVLVILGLLAVAGFLRIGWTKKGGTP